jgi:hypothetical protein
VPAHATPVAPPLRRRDPERGNGADGRGDADPEHRVQPTQRQEQRPQLKRCKRDRDPDEQRSARPRSRHGARRRSGSLRSVRVELLDETRSPTSGSRSPVRSSKFSCRSRLISSRSSLVGRSGLKPWSASPAVPACAASRNGSRDHERRARSDGHHQRQPDAAHEQLLGYFLGLDMALRISSPQDSILGSRSPRNPVRLKARGMVAPSVAPGRLALHHSGAST